MSCNSTYWVLHFLPDLYWRPVVGTAIILVSLFATVENFIILYVFAKNPSLRTTSNKILISMGFADFCTGILLGPLYAAYMFQSSNEIDCISNEARRYFATLFLGASALSAGILSIDRSLRLRSLRGFKLNDNALYVMLSINWFLPVVVPLTALVNPRAYALVIFILGVVAVAVVIISYIVLIIALKKYTSNINAEMRERSNQRERNAGMTVIIISTCYIAMLLPLLIDKLLYALKYYEGVEPDTQAKVMIIAHVICTANSIVNPIIYVNRIPDLRTHVFDLFKWRHNAVVTVKTVSINENSV